MSQVSFWSRRRVLITGGLGFIGSNLARRLVALGSEILLVDSGDDDCGANLANIKGLESRLELRRLDIGNHAPLAEVVKGQAVLFNLAGRTSHQDSMDNPFADFASNCAAQISILESCRRHNPDARIVFASTRQVYGKPQYLPVDERHPLNPTDVNGINKMAAEAYHMLYARVYGLPVCSLRLTNTFGPRMRIRDARQTFLGVWIRDALKEQPFSVWGGKQLRDLNFVDDVVDALLLAAESENAIGGIYNLGGSEVISLHELAEKLIKVNGSGSYRVEQFPEERKRIDIGDYYGCFERFSSLGWSPKIGIEEGLQRTLDYFRDHLAEYI